MMKRTVSSVIIFWVLALGIFITGASFTRYMETAAPAETILTKIPPAAEPAYMSVITYMRAIETALRTAGGRRQDPGPEEERDLLIRHEEEAGRDGMAGPPAKKGRNNRAEALWRNDDFEERIDTGARGERQPGRTVKE